MSQLQLQPFHNFVDYTVATMVNDEPPFGDWLREQRQKAGLTLKQVAEKSGLSFSYISTLERNQPHSVTGKEIQPQREGVIALARALNADVNEVLERAGLRRQHPLESHILSGKIRIEFLDNTLTPEEREDLLRITTRQLNGILVEKDD